ncbi:hypothetical protein [Taibaiella koreensis]|uniref:hypothetical protein n=1 Tax=Taibaiella koreensis TaxID=1268548 RepID=UPI000E59F646|nr:hypothetical protein [Taibaiella koreensis]
MSRSSRRDLLIFTGIIFIFLSLYFYGNAVLEMYTDRHIPGVLIGLGIACYFYIFYLVRRYLRERNEKLLSSLGASLGPALLLWGLIAFNYNKIPMLAGYWRSVSTHATLPLLDVSKRKYKGSFNGGKVKTVLGPDTVTLDCSRTLYFALKDRQSVAADFGLSADGRNWFISKVYIDEEAYSKARGAYWQNWRERRYPLLIILGIVVIGAVVLFKLDEAGIIHLKRAGESRPASEKPSAKRIMILVLVFFALTFLGLLLYILFMVLSHR